MKNIFKVLLVLAVSLVIPSCLIAAEDVPSALQKGLFEEEANNDLETAIKAYQTVVTRTDEQRKFAATAVFRLGECYRKLGKTNEAAAYYSRLLRDFAEQTQLVKLSQDHLGNMGVKIATAPSTNQPSSLPPSPTATEDAEIARLQRLLTDSPDLVNAKDGNGRTPLHIAAENGYARVVGFLLTNRANIHIKNSSHMTPLLVATMSGHKEVIELLIRQGADVNTTDNYGATPVNHAAYWGRKAVLEVLVDAGAKLEPAGVPGGRGGSGTPLHIATERGFHAIVESLLAKGAAVDAKNYSGETPLHVAGQLGHLAIAETLLANKADVNAIDGKGETPLHYAASGRHVATVELLLRHKADVNVYGKSGTPLLSAASVGAHEIAKLLLAAGADVNAQNEQGYAVLHYAAEWESLPLMKEALRHKPDVNLQMGRGLTPLYKAVITGRTELVKELLQAGANPNLAADEGDTPLHLAADKRYTEIVALLLEHKADPNMVNPAGQTAFDIVKSTPGFSSGLPRLPVVAQPGVQVPPRRTVPQIVNPPPPMLAPQTVQPNTPQRPGSAKGAADQVVDLLLKHGADPDMKRRLSIAVVRNLATQTPQSIFFKGTNTVNRYTLFELIAKLYGRSSGHAMLDQGFSFPDLSRITINRLKAVGKSEDIKLDVAALLRSADCTKDVWLEWGDIVHIPEQEHPLNTGWQGFDDEVITTLTNCLRRQVTVIVKGKADNLTLNVRADTQGRTPGLPGPSLPAVFNFYLSEVLHGSGLLLTTSDRTRVKVTRKDPVTKQELEMTFDITGRPGVYDLWLRNGDVIEVPEKGETQKSAQAGEE